MLVKTADCHLQLGFKAVFYLDYLVFLTVPVRGKLSEFSRRIQLFLLTQGHAAELLAKRSNFYSEFQVKALSLNLALTVS